MFSDIDLVYKYLYVQSSENLGSGMDGWSAGAAQRGSTGVNLSLSGLIAPRSPQLSVHCSITLSFIRIQMDVLLEPPGIFFETFHSSVRRTGKLREEKKTYLSLSLWGSFTSMS